MCKKPHVVMIPCPAQGHVAPLMKFAYKLADHGIKVTVVNTHSIHAKIMASIPKEAQEQIPVSLVSVPDGMDSDEANSMLISRHLQDLIESIGSGLSGDEHIVCVIADLFDGLALDVARKKGIKRAAFVPCGIGNLALVLHASKLIESGVIDPDGIPIRDEFICLSKEIPPWHSNELGWSCSGDPAMQKFIFSHYVVKAAEAVRISDWLLINSCFELELTANDLILNILPIGPLLTSDHSRPFSGNLWPEESTCLSWLDKQPEGSVIYVAFGSTGVFKQQEFHELALGLELTGLPFLWVVRSGCTHGKLAEFPDGFAERTKDSGHIVGWGPQEKVLSHPAVACFLSHCGWNSIIEGVSMGVPFLCWPYFADQYHNRSYVCEAWKVGLSLVPDESGIVTGHEIRTKITRLVSDGDIKTNSLKLKELARKCVNEGGSSFRNFTSFLEQLKQ